MTVANYVRIVPSINRIDIQVIVPKNFMNFDKIAKEVPYTLDRIREDALDYWKTLASQKLNTSRHAYINNMSSHATNKDNFVLRLSGPFATSIEKGWDRFDMKPGFSRSTKLKDGPIRIPKDKRSELSGVPTPKPYKWMIIPINDKGDIKFRTFTTQQSGWINKRYEGVHLIPEVKKKLKEEIIINRFKELFAKYGIQ